jgi:acyl carrier protein
MGGENLQQRLYALVSSQLGVEHEELVPQARILDDLGADSLDVVELVMALEESFDIVVPDEDVEALQTLLDVQKYVELRTATS